MKNGRKGDEKKQDKNMKKAGTYVPAYSCSL